MNAYRPSLCSIFLTERPPLLLKNERQKDVFWRLTLPLRDLITGCLSVGQRVLTAGATRSPGPSQISSSLHQACFSFHLSYDGDFFLNHACVDIPARAGLRSLVVPSGPWSSDSFLLSLELIYLPPAEPEPLLRSPGNEKLSVSARLAKAPCQVLSPWGETRGD